jgi:hypothetical protein
MQGTRMDLKKLMVEHSINEFWQKIKDTKSAA